MLSDLIRIIRIRVAVATLGCVLAACALALLWTARLRVDRPVYVSELGADGEPTAALFELALLLIVGGGLCVAWAGRGVRAAVPVLRAWTVSTSVTIAAGLFFVASQVPCTVGCPLPVGPSATVQDAVHTSAAVLAFAAASVAMLQASFTRREGGLRVVSLVCGISVAAIAATGGILSLIGFATAVGGVLELVATTIAVSWLVAFGAVSAAHPAPTNTRRPALRAAVRVSA